MLRPVTPPDVSTGLGENPAQAGPLGYSVSAVSSSRDTKSTTSLQLVVSQTPLHSIVWPSKPMSQVVGSRICLAGGDVAFSNARHTCPGVAIWPGPKVAVTGLESQSPKLRIS